MCRDASPRGVGGHSQSSGASVYGATVQTDGGRMQLGDAHWPTKLLTIGATLRMPVPQLVPHSVCQCHNWCHIGRASATIGATLGVPVPQLVPHYACQ